MPPDDGKDDGRGETGMNNYDLWDGLSKASIHVLREGRDE